MDHDDHFSVLAGRVERSTRLAGVLLLVGAVLTHYLTELLFSRSPANVALFEGFTLAARILAPAGATLIAASLATRALFRPYSRPSAGAQLVAGLTLLVAGLLQIAFGREIMAGVSDVLGPTARAGVLLAVALSRVVFLTALPLGIALLAVQPLIRLARMWLVHTTSAGPPDIESLP